MKIFVATYESSCGYPRQKVFKNKTDASKWLKRRFFLDFTNEGSEMTYKEWSTYGGWTAKIKSYTI